MYQLRSNCRGTFRSSFRAAGPQYRRRRHRHHHRTPERAVRYGRQPGSHGGTPVMADDDVGIARTARRADVQSVIHQSAQVVGAIRGQRGRHIATHERRDHPVSRSHQMRREFPETVGGIRKAVQAQNAIGASDGPTSARAAEPRVH